MSVRLGSRWRRDSYNYLAERDGAVCGKCRARERAIWRPMGVCSNGDWEWDWVCRNRMTRVYPTSNLEVDHKHPLHLGGSNDEDNLWLLCIDCHKTKTIAERQQRARRQA